MSTTLLNLLADDELVSGQFDDGDLYLVHSISNGRDMVAKRSSLVTGLVQEGGDANLDEVTIADLTATAAQANTLTVVTSMAMGATLSKILFATGSVTFTDILTTAGQTQTFTLTGALTTDTLLWSFGSAIPDGVIAQAWISAANTVSVRFWNTTGSTISGASYTFKAIALRASNPS